MSIRYFYAKDLVDRGKVTIEYCPAEKIIANFFTKLLQGALCTNFRDVILGYEPVLSIFPEKSNNSKECVNVNKDLCKVKTSQMK